MRLRPFPAAVSAAADPVTGLACGSRIGAATVINHSTLGQTLAAQNTNHHQVKEHK
ncbi:hypothetical protein OEM_p100450 (plasmid) [Mycobacterium intracellulare subsp. yongonense 05-1390]|nr:hypothetical protein OEM_p100450 [Mycobacterium intracellulare subsp. yongonense 05-1390]